MAKHSVFEGIDDYTHLGEDDFSAILNQVSDLATKYKQLGTELGINQKDLTKIRRENPTDIMRLGDVILSWLHVEPKPTWRSLAEALHKVDPELAQDVAKRLQAKDKSPSSYSLQFTKDMPNDEFFMFLRTCGAMERDISVLKGQGITAQVFSELDDSDLHELGLSFGGRKVLRKLLHEVNSATCDTSSSQSSSSVASTEKYLKVDDLSSILDELYDVSPKWYSIGLQLRLPISDLDAISKENQHPRDCLLEVIHIWLKRSAKPTWKDLVDALESPTVGYPALGRSLRIRRTLSDAADDPCTHVPVGFKPFRVISDQLLDFESGGVPKHLAQIADSMYEWEGPIAEQLGLTGADVAAIRMKYPSELRLQSRAALMKWKQMHGSEATYKNLIDTFEKAGYRSCADAVKMIVHNTSASHIPEYISVPFGATLSKELCDMSKPNSLNLSVIPWRNKQGEIKKFRLKASLFHKWRTIGKLVVPEPQLVLWSKIKDDYECCEAVLSYWLDHPPPDYPATWEGLYELLDDSKLGQVATELKQAVDNAT